MGIKQPDYKGLQKQIHDAIHGMSKGPQKPDEVMESLVGMVNFLEEQHVKAILCALGVFKLGCSAEQQPKAVRQFLDGCTRDFEINLRNAVQVVVSKGILLDPYRSQHNDQVREAILRELADANEENTG